MLLKNYYKLITGMTLGSQYDASVTTQILGDNCYITRPNGTTAYANDFDILKKIDNLYISYSVYVPYGQDHVWLVLSNDDTPVSYEDYTMPNLLYDDGTQVTDTYTSSLGLTTIKVSSVTYNENGTFQYTYKASIVNRGSKSFTIKKWGLVATTNKNESQGALFFASVLDEPFQVESLETVTATFTFVVTPARPIQ